MWHDPKVAHGELVDIKALPVMALLAPQFIGWSKLLAESVSSSRLEGQAGGPTDLGSHRVIVPSSFV